MRIWTEVLAMQPGFCQAGSLCLVSGMDEETMLGHFTVCLVTVLLVCFALTKIKMEKEPNDHFKFKIPKLPNL